jgi:hypothetical protein
LPTAHSWNRSPEESRQTRKIAIPNFFARNALISHISPKKKFGKICKAKLPTVENKGIFCGSNAPNRADPRHPRVLQGFEQDQCRSGAKKRNRAGKLIRAFHFSRGKKTAPPGALNFRRRTLGSSRKRGGAVRKNRGQDE